MRGLERGERVFVCLMQRGYDNNGRNEAAMVRSGYSQRDKESNKRNEKEGFDIPNKSGIIRSIADCPKIKKEKDFSIAFPALVPRTGIEPVIPP